MKSRCPFTVTKKKQKKHMTSYWHIISITGARRGVAGLSERSYYCNLNPGLTRVNLETPWINSFFGFEPWIYLYCIVTHVQGDIMIELHDNSASQTSECARSIDWWCWKPWIKVQPWINNVEPWIKVQPWINNVAGLPWITEILAGTVRTSTTEWL